MKKLRECMRYQEFLVDFREYKVALEGLQPLIESTDVGDSVIDAQVCPCSFLI